MSRNEPGHVCNKIFLNVHIIMFWGVPGRTKTYLDVLGCIRNQEQDLPKYIDIKDKYITLSLIDIRYVSGYNKIFSVLLKCKHEIMGPVRFKKKLQLPFMRATGVESL